MRNGRPGLLSLAFVLSITAAACGGAGPRDARTNPPAASQPAPQPAAPAAPPAETADTLDVDTPMTTPSGATYTAPKGWTVTTRSSVVVLTDPNREVSVTFVV